MEEILFSKLSMNQRLAVEPLGEGPIVFVYLDGNNICMETMDGIDPYVWSDGKWCSKRTWR
jgi:hypothetical protein